MRLVELIDYFRKGGSFDEFCQSHSLNSDSDAIEIYMSEQLSVDNELAFFEIEETNGEVEFHNNGVRYFNLFDFYFFLDAIEESNNIENVLVTEAELAERLIQYAITDS